ncbi:MAG: hypothetical protein SF172_01825 [Burkholderiales bacterium]|nr:hypothetical protein [Burkholderiales bacterium]
MTVLLASIAIVVAWLLYRDDEPKLEPSGNQARAASGTASLDAALAAIAVSPSPAVLGGPSEKKLTAREMLLSKDPGLIEYAAITLKVHCRSIETTEDVWMQSAEEGFVEGGMRGSLSFGAAPLPTRLAAYRRSREVCRGIFPEGFMSEAFMEALRATPEFERFRSMGIRLDAANLGSQEGKAVLKEVMDASMHLTVKNLLMYRSDTSRFEGMFPAREGGEMLWYAAAELMACRMGEDCRADSPKTLQLCWGAGICGGDYESALSAHLRSKGVDADLLARLVTEFHGRLQRGDTSWLRSQPRKPKS